LLGVEVEINFIDKHAFHCDIKFPELLYKQGLYPLLSEKLLIQVDTLDQEVNYESEIFILGKFEVYEPLRITPKSVILSQKLWTITQRKRLKGRDFFDVMFLLQNTSPDLPFLAQTFGTDDLGVIKSRILDYTANADFDYLADDMRPFLFTPEDASKIKHFRALFDQSFS
jgi:hypothetical protein